MDALKQVRNFERGEVMMDELDLFNKIQRAYGMSTHNDNRFAKCLESIKWDYKFYADGEYYYGKDGFNFSTPSLDPFDMKWEASGIFSDGSMMSFK